MRSGSLERRAGLTRSGALPPVSARRARAQRARTALLRALYPDGFALCAWPGCRQLADDAHEPLTRARGGGIADERNHAPLCRPHHELATVEDPEAYAAGLLIHSWGTDARPLLFCLACKRRVPVTVCGDGSGFTCGQGHVRRTDGEAAF